MTGNKEHQPLTSGIKHCGLSGYASILPRIKFSVTGQDSSPQSPTISYRRPLSASKNRQINMTTIVIILIVIVVIAVIVSNNKKKSNSTLPTTTGQTNSNNSSSSSSSGQQVFTGDYLPQSIQRTGLQVLETLNIIGTSKALDTITGRFTFLLSIIDTLKKGSVNARYMSDIQKSIDTYKSMYYDRVPQDYELAFLLKPKDFDLLDFYCKSLYSAFRRNYEDHTEEIKLLKREDAKVRRKEKIKELLKFTKDELTNKCSNSPSFSDVIIELEKIETSLTSDADNTNFISNNSLEVLQTKVIANSSITSIKTKENTSNKGTEFKLNPGSPFELTLLNSDDKLGKKIKNILEDEKIYDNKKRDQIVALFSEYNLEVKEVEAYKTKYGKIYHDKLNELKSASSEWQLLGEKDKEDLLEDFREIAIKTVYEQANCNLVTLFENEPTDITVDDELIKEYGFENIETYLRFADNLEKVRVVQNDNYNRPRFEKLVDLGLAIRGGAIPLDEILSTLTLKELNDIAKNSEKEYKRKNQAIEYILTLPNIEEKLGVKVSLRELFKLKALPEKYSAVNLKQVSDAWAYTYEVVELLVNTYRNSIYSAQTLKDKEYVKEYKVECWSNEENMCPCAKDLINKTYPKARPPKIPYHIGCNCSLRQEYNFN